MKNEEMKFIIDEEINLNELDFLKTKGYSELLSKIIKNTETNKPFIIGIFGGWGTGKSSIIETSKQDFGHEKIKFITYDAWQYVNDSFRRMFLRKLREDLRYEETDLMKKFYANESIDTGIKYQLSSGGFVSILAILIVALAIFTFIPFPIDYKFPVYAIITLIGLLVAIKSELFNKLKISVTKPHLFAPEQFEDCFKDIVSNSLKETNNISAIKNWVKGDKSIKNLDKLVIVIDNIDRCTNDNAYRLLTDIKTFLASEDLNIVFIIPVDDEALRKHIFSKTNQNFSENNSNNSNKEKEEFLRKFFNVNIRIRPYGESDIFSFAKEICKKADITFNPETINIASKEYAKNPRRVIQLFNNLQTELSYYDADFAEKNETVICAVLIIREEYPKYYKKLINSPKLFNEKDEKEEDKELNRFIRIIKGYVGEIKTSDLNKILTNSDNQFDEIDKELLDAIYTFDEEKVLKLYKSDEDKVFDYILYKMGFSIKNDLIDSELVKYFELFICINKEESTPAHINKRINEIIMPNISILIDKIGNSDNLCNFARDNESLGNDEIKEEIFKYLLESDFKKDYKQSYRLNLFNSVLKYFSDEKSSKRLSNIFTNIHHDINSIEFSDDQWNYLISDKYIEDVFSNFPKNDEDEIQLDINTKEYKETKTIFKDKNNIKESTYQNLFKLLIGNENQNLMDWKSVEGIIELIKFINPLLDLIPDEKLTNESETFYNRIVNDRKFYHPSYPNNQNYSQQENFINQCIESEENILDIIQFIINIYRISDVDISTEIEKLVDNYREDLNKEFINLINNGYSLYDLIELIFDDSDYENENTLIILKHCFNQKEEDGSYCINEQSAKKKIRELLDFDIDNESDEIFDLINSLTEEVYYKNIFNKIIINNHELINKLPIKYQDLSIECFNKDNYDDFSENFNFLKIIIKNGENSQKKCIVDIIVKNLDNDVNIENTFEIIELMDNINEYDSNGLLLPHLKQYLGNKDESTDDKLIERTKEIIKTIQKENIES